MKVLGPTIAAVEFNRCARRATTPEDEYYCDDASTTVGAYAFLQGIGAGLIAAGYLGRRKCRVRSDRAVQIAPWQTRSAFGLDVAGRF